MPQPDRRPERRPARNTAQSGRQRPGASPLAPSPTPLMPVPDSGSGDRQGPPHTAAQGRGRASATPDPDELVYLSGRVPRSLRDEFHIQAIREQRPVVELLRDAIRGYLDRG